MRSPLPGRRRTPRFWRFAAASLALLLLGGAVTGCSSDDGPERTLTAFLAGWRSGNLDKVGFMGPDGGTFPATQALESLRSATGDLAKTTPVVTAAGKPKVTADVASSAITVAWPLPGGATWSYPSTVRLARHGEGWRVIWEPSILHPQLTADEKLALRWRQATRAGLLDSAGKPLVTPRPVVVIGVSPEKITNLPRLTKALTAAFKKIDLTIDMSNLPDRVEHADPGAFIELVTLRRPDYDKIRTLLRPLAGTVFRPEQRDLAPTRTFARALLGTVGPAQKADVDAHPDTIAPTDMVGHGGLLGQYDARLRGVPGRTVVIARKAPDGTVTDTELFRTDAKPGTPVRTTLDVVVQNAADRAVATEKQRSALVAMRITDGHVLAAANGPDGGTTNLALTAQVPPGSTFKMVSALGLLQKGAVTVDKAVDCPKTVTVDGATFRNSHKMALGRVPFRTVFAKSCNTAFAGLAPHLGAGGLADTAAQLGLGGSWNIGIEAFTGKVSRDGSPAERAAAAFGQGATAVSPIAMATATAAVAGGTYRRPQLVLDPAPTTPAANPAPLDPAAVDGLQTVMREVVTRGTGTALRDVPGKPVYGKTGTAEFATGSKETHAWFIGWQGDIAVAVLVEKGGAGADAAVPIVERFLRDLAKG